MNHHRLGVIGECETRTQGILVLVVRGRPRTQNRAAERGHAAERFFLRQVPDILAMILRDRARRQKERHPRSPFFESTRRVRAYGQSVVPTVIVELGPVSIPVLPPRVSEMQNEVAV